VPASDILLDMGGVVGVVLVLIAYAGIHFDWYDPKKAPALLMNLFGSALILLSMVRAFNLSAFLMEAAWAAMALYGLAKLALRR
jgi:paired small multidrug resistance pump